MAWNQTPGQVRPAAGEGLPGGQPGGAERLGVAVPDGRQNPHGNPNPVPAPHGGDGIWRPGDPERTFGRPARSLHA